MKEVQMLQQQRQTRAFRFSYSGLRYSSAYYLQNLDLADSAKIISSTHATYWEENFNHNINWKRMNGYFTPNVFSL